MSETASDQQLLRDYAAHRSQDAFAELVRRHVDLVYSACLRQLGDEHFAEDATQSTFIVLAGKAGKISENSLLAGWLYNTARHVSRNMKRMEIRRKNREATLAAMKLQEESPVAPAAWEQVSPLLDHCMAKLCSHERDLLLLRYFQEKRIAQIGEYFGVTEKAAAKRLERALDRLRQLLVREDAALSAVGLGKMLEIYGIRSAPPSVVGAAIGAGANTPWTGSPAQVAARSILTSAHPKLAIAACIAVLVIGSIATVLIAQLPGRPVARMEPATQPAPATLPAPENHDEVIAMLQQVADGYDRHSTRGLDWSFKGKLFSEQHAADLAKPIEKGYEMAPRTLEFVYIQKSGKRRFEMEWVDPGVRLYELDNKKLILGYAGNILRIFPIKDEEHTWSSRAHNYSEYLRFDRNTQPTSANVANGARALIESLKDGTLDKFGVKIEMIRDADGIYSLRERNERPTDVWTWMLKIDSRKGYNIVESAETSNNPKWSYDLHRRCEFKAVDAEHWVLSSAIKKGVENNVAFEGRMTIDEMKFGKDVEYADENFEPASLGIPSFVYVEDYRYTPTREYNMGSSRPRMPVEAILELSSTAEDENPATQPAVKP